MTALLHARPTLNIRVKTFSESARRRQDLAWMLRVPGWNVDGGALWHDPWLVVPRIVWPEARADRSGHPVQHNFVSSTSRTKNLSTSPSQSLQERNFSTIHAARPTGESVSA